MNALSPAWTRLAAVVLLILAPHLPAQSIPFLIEPVAPAPAKRLIWQTEPGVRYDLFQSTDLLSWTHVPGYPATAVGLSQEYSFNLGPRGFFRIVPIDEQPPVVVEQFPAVGGFAVGRFADLSIRLSDPSGIDPASIRFTVGASGPMLVGAPGLSFTGDTLTYDSGAAPLGAYGQVVTATLIAADTLGHPLTHTWTFKLEPAPVVAGNIFVFGAAPPPSGAWTIESVAADRIVIDYTGATAPALTVGQKLCNSAPAKVQEIFYRRVLSVSDNPATSRLTIFTEDIPLTDFVQTGSVAFTPGSIVYSVAADGTLVPPPPLSGTITFPRTGFDLSGSELKLRPDGYEATVLGVTSSFGDDAPWIEIEATEWSWWFTPRLRVALEIGFGGLKSFEAIASGDISVNNDFAVDVLLTGLSSETTVFDLPEHLEPKHVLYLGQMGPIPVYALLAFDFKIKTKAEAQAVIDYSFSYRQDISANFGLTYDESSGLDWVKGFQATAPDLDSSVALTGRFSLDVRLVPEPQFLVYGLAGFLVNIEPHAGISVDAGTSGFDGKLEVGVDFTLAPAGPAFAFLPVGTELRFPIWEGEWPLIPETLAFTSHPQTRTVAPGADVSFTCIVDSSSPASFRWFHNGTPLPGQISRTLFLPRVNTGHAGLYFVRATAGSSTADSNAASLTVQTPTPANTDTDGDGLPNVVETNTGVWVSSSNTGTNPLLWDTDGDGLRDGVETHTGVFLSLSNTGTDPLDPDSDNDGVNDKAESDRGTDPNIADLQLPFGDNFNDNIFDDSRWTRERNTVIETNNQMQIVTTTTDNGGLLRTRPLRIESNKSLTLERRVLLHRANDYAIPQINLIVNGERKFTVHFAHMIYDGFPHSACYGIYIAKGSGSPHSRSTPTSDLLRLGNVPWDTWFDERITYNPGSGNVSYFINGVLLGIFTTLPVASSTYDASAIFESNAWGWWTGHYQYFDDVRVSQ